jgi:uncharacterized protein
LALRPLTRQVNDAMGLRVRRIRATRRRAMHIEHEPGRFVARIDGEEAELLYQRREETLDVHHTYTPPALRGSAIAARLTAAAFEYAKEQGLKILPTCSYTRAYAERHPELHSLLHSSSRSVK